MFSFYLSFFFPPPLTRKKKKKKKKKKEQKKTYKMEGIWPEILMFGHKQAVFFLVGLSRIKSGKWISQGRMVDRTTEERMVKKALWRIRAPKKKSSVSVNLL